MGPCLLWPSGPIIHGGPHEGSSKFLLMSLSPNPILLSSNPRSSPTSSNKLSPGLLPSIAYLLNNLLSIDYRGGKYIGLCGPDQVGLWVAGGHMLPLSSMPLSGNVGPVMNGRSADFYGLL